MRVRSVRVLACLPVALLASRLFSRVPVCCATREPADSSECANTSACLPHARMYLHEMWWVARCQYVAGSVAPAAVIWCWVGCTSGGRSGHAGSVLSCLPTGLLEVLRRYFRIPVNRVLV